MKFVIVGMVVGLLLVGLGCSGGMSEEEVTRVIEVRDLEIQQAMHEGMLKQRQYLVEQILSVEKFMDDAETNIREVARAEGAHSVEQVKSLTEDVAVEIRHFLDNVIRAICETDYITNTVIGLLYALLAYLQGDGTTLEEVELYFHGIIIGEDYEDVSAVCRVDADGRWVLIQQLDKILPERRG